jgi:hypothetical protein
MDEEKKQTARIVERARVMRTLIIIAGFLFFFLCLAAAIYLFVRRQAAWH